MIIINKKNILIGLLLITSIIIIIVSIIFGGRNNAYTYLKDYPRINNETTDIYRIKRAIDETNKILIIDEDKYELGNIDIVISKPIIINGNNSTFMNGGIILESNSIEINDLNIDCPTLDNGFQANTKAVKDIVINNCTSIARDHSYLFESYNGVVENIVARNSSSSEATHGFISKAKNVTFENCIAKNHKENGFGFISDNITGEDKKGEAKYNKAINCYAENCYTGFVTYSRDYFSNSNENELEMSDLSLLDCETYNCVTGIQLGDGNYANDGQTYNQVREIKIIDGNILSGEKSVFSYDIGLGTNIEILGGYIEKPISANEDKYNGIIIDDVEGL